MPDVVVVGGGVIGAACAHALASRGVSVTLVERDELAAGASGRNQGLWVQPSDPLLLPMARASLAAYLGLVPAAPIDFGLDPAPVGTVLMALDDHEAAEGELGVRTWVEHGVGVELLDAARLHEVEPDLTDSVAAAWLVDQGRRLDPAALTVALALEAKARGAEIRHHLAARALWTEGETVRGIVTDEGRVEAATTVVAAGPWSGNLLEPAGVRLPIVGARGWLVRVSPPGGLELRHLVEQAGWRESPEREDAVRPLSASELARGLPGAAIGSLVHAARDGTILIGSSRQAWTTPEPEDPSVPGRILEGAIRLVPRLAEAEVRSSWWGLRPMTPDERPIVGRVRGGLVVATGHGSEGVILGAGTAELVASIVAGGERPFDPAPFDPFRFEREPAVDHGAR